RLCVVEVDVLPETAGKDVGRRRVDTQVEQRELFEDFVEAQHVIALRERAMERDRLATLGKLADVRRVVEGLDVLARARDGHAVEQLEEVEVQRVQNGA